MSGEIRHYIFRPIQKILPVDKRGGKESVYDVYGLSVNKCLKV